MHPELTSGARDGVHVPNVAAALMPVGHIDELGVHSDKAMVDCQSYFDGDYLPNHGELGDGAVDKVGVLNKLYKIVTRARTKSA